METNFETTEILDGILSSSIRSQTLTVVTKHNDEVEENREFVIVIEHTTTEFNPPSLVKLTDASRTLVITIEDDDISEFVVPFLSVSCYFNSHSLQTHQQSLMLLQLHSLAILMGRGLKLVGSTTQATSSQWTNTLSR